MLEFCKSMSQHFTHLHLHTEFSLLDGAISLDKLIKFGKEHNFKSLAISDHGNIFGAVKFFQKCKKAGIKPILGMEAYFTEDATVKQIERKYHHLILIVQNEIGYKNLCKLISFSYQRGFYFKPRIDYEALKRHNEGLIVTSACLGGHIPSLLMTGNEEAAQERMDWFLDVFGPERFYLEVQPPDQQEQKILNEKLFAWSGKKGIPLVATGDCHYILPEDREAHEIFLAIQTQHKLTDPDRFTFGEARCFMRTQQQMLEIFADHPQAVWNSGIIADQCDFDFPSGKLFFPAYDVPSEHTPETFFSHLCQLGLQELIDTHLIPADQIEIYKQRLEIEVSLITTMGFVGYFLIVSDFIQWAKRNGVPVGPGRGSAAGSLVAWALKITNVDPIKYNLLFERFLNPERVSMPDIDIDFCIDGRERVINYVRERYGHDHVGQIITFGTLMAKGVVKDVARVLGLPFEDSNAITALIPEQLKITLKEALEQEPRLKDLAEQSPHVRKIFDIAFRLEGLTRHASKHAAGIVISPEPIDTVLPVYIPSKTTDLVTQYAMSELESIGFLKIDLLGLKNLTVIDRTLRLIEQNHGIKFDMDHLALNDPKTFQLICQGKTSGVFQLESAGIKDVLIKLQPEKFEDIIAVNALYRPGPLGSGMVDDFIERRHGKQAISYLFDALAPILQETYGIIVYQEQVMSIASVVAGYSLGESDILRRAMGKKKIDVMAQQRDLFLTRAAERNFDATKAGELFDLMAYFADYGFNKSHSTAYALIAYQTAYLKAHYPAEFMASVISLESDNAESMAFYLQEAKGCGIAILPPNINNSEIDFTVINGEILFGLKGVKNVGLACLENVLGDRTKNGPFADLLDFCCRVDLRTCNKRVLENLICAGAFDALPGNRAQKYSELSAIMEQAIHYKKAQETGQLDLFASVITENNSVPLNEQYQFTALAEWTSKEKLGKEQEVIGFFLSSHPLDSYKNHQQWIGLVPFGQLSSLTATASGQEPVVISYGVLQSTKTIFTKKGERMAFSFFEDESGKAEVILFPKVYSQVEQWLEGHSVFVIKGTVDLTNPHASKIKAFHMVPLDLMLQEWGDQQSIILSLPPSFSLSELGVLKDRPEGVAKKIPLQILFYENDKKLRLKTEGFVTNELLTSFHQANISIKIIL